MSQDADNLYIARTKAVAGCFSMFLLMFGLTFTPLFFPASQDLLAKGLLFPLLFALEFIVLVPLYYFFFRKREDLEGPLWVFFFSTTMNVESKLSFNENFFVF